MNRSVLICFFLTLLSTCEKPLNTDQPVSYDLFPLEVGNSFYYSQSKHSFSVYAGCTWYVKSRFKWTVLEKTVMADSILYWLEHFSAMRRSYTDIDCPSTWDTVYSDTIRFYFKILEHTSTGDFWIMDHDCAGGPFPRYSSQADSSILRDVWIGNNQLKESWHYAADTGLRTYSYSYWSAHRNEGYGFSLDSLHLVMHE